MWSQEMQKITLQDYNPEESDTEPSESPLGHAEPATCAAASPTEAMNASVSPETLPSETLEEASRRERIASLLQDSLAREHAANAVGGPAAPVGAFAGGEAAMNYILNMSRTVGRTGCHVTECSVSAPAESTSATSNVPWRLRVGVGSFEQPSDFGMGPVQFAATVSGSSGCRGAPPDKMHVTAASSGASSLPSRGRFVPPPRRPDHGGLASSTRAPDAQGLTSLPPRPPRRLPVPRTAPPRAAPYDLPGAESSREERPSAAAALGMSRRQYERLLGMERWQHDRLAWKKCFLAGLIASANISTSSDIAMTEAACWAYKILICIQIDMFMSDIYPVHLIVDTLVSVH